MGWGNSYLPGWAWQKGEKIEACKWWQLLSSRKLIQIVSPGCRGIGEFYYFFPLITFSSMFWPKLNLFHRVLQSIFSFHFITNLGHSRTVWRFVVGRQSRGARKTEPRRNYPELWTLFEIQEKWQLNIYEVMIVNLVLSYIYPQWK